MATPVQTGSIMKPRRTRICGPQSKNGCFTCKARRIKCDEEKPGCLRCARSGRVCEGYPERENDDAPAAVPPIKESRADAFLDHTPSIKSNPSRALRTGCTRSERQHRLAQLGIGLLSFDSFGRFGASGAVLDILLPQLCHSIPSVGAAATALGAVHETQASYGSTSPADQAFAASQYRIALRTLHRDLLTQPHGPTPLIMICFILSIAEVFLQQESNALFHLRGAYKLLQDRRKARLSYVPARSDAIDNHLCYPEDDIEIILRTVDFQTCTYALSKTPDLPAISFHSSLPCINDLSSARITLTQIVHACYIFTSTAYGFRYLPQSANPSIFIQQGRHIAHLSTWFEQFDLVILHKLRNDCANPSQVKLYSHALTLRVTALSILIHLSCILCPYESFYDAHAAHFQQIVADTEAIISARDKDSYYSIRGIDGERFTTGSGLIQPLFFVAYKCRHPLHRRRAITLLSSAGREGPWSGPREACITSRITELEEKWPNNSSLASKNVDPSSARVRTGARANTSVRPEVTSPTTAIPASGVCSDSTTTNAYMLGKVELSSRGWASTGQPEEYISESARIHTMGMRPKSVNGRPSNQVIVRFSRCLDIERMLSYPCGHGSDSHFQGPCMNNPHWEFWEEVLTF